MKKYEFTGTNELSKKAFGVYSNSSFCFYKDGDTFFAAYNLAEEPFEIGGIEDVESFLSDFADEEDFDFDDLETSEMDKEIKNTIIMYDEAGELIQRLVVENLSNISIDYEKKVFHAEYIGDGYNEIKNGEILNIAFYKMVII